MSNRIEAWIDNLRQDIAAKLSSGELTKADVTQLSVKLKVGPEEHLALHKNNLVGLTVCFVDQNEYEILEVLIGGKPDDFNRLDVATKVAITRLLAEPTRLDEVGAEIQAARARDEAAKDEMYLNAKVFGMMVVLIFVVLLILACVLPGGFSFGK